MFLCGIFSNYGFTILTLVSAAFVSKGNGIMNVGKRAVAHIKYLSTCLPTCSNKSCQRTVRLTFLSVG